MDEVEIRFVTEDALEIPEAVFDAATAAAQVVFDNYRRTGTVCGHAAVGPALACGVMVCPSYAGRV